MSGNTGHQGNGQLFKESKEPQNHSYVPDRKKNLVSISEMEVNGGTHRWKGTCLEIEFSKMFLSLGLYQIVGSPLRTMSIVT